MTLKQFVICVCLVIILNCCASENAKLTPPIVIKSGKVKGLILKSNEERTIYAFKNIPYGKSTAGTRRFMPPEPADPWEGILESTTELGPQCPQFNTVLRKGEGSEDCLVINAYTPQISTGKFESLLPVMVFIHGGGFVIGTGSYGFYGPEKLLDYGIVLVTFNYRLGILGFLNTEDKVAPGNYGMLDQVLALRWVKENIAAFGGDPERVTIFGESAGSASVVYHLLSPLSKGLFHRAIAQSGSIMNPWSFQKEPLQWAQKLAKQADCPTNDTHKLVDCLKTKTMKEIMAAQQGIQVTVFHPSYCAPSIDGPGGQGFLIGNPTTLMKNGKIANKVPFIVGLNELEGLAFAQDFKKTITSKVPEDYFKNEFVKALTGDVANCKPHMAKVFQAIQEEYFHDIDVWDYDSFSLAVTRLYSDIKFGVGIAKTADYTDTAGVPTWTYMFTHVGKHSLSELFGVPPGDYATHMDEIFLQFPFFFAQYAEMTANDTSMSKILNTFWTTFAKGENLAATVDGSPVLWQQYNSHSPNFLKLNLQPEMKNGLLVNNLEFWSKTVPRLISKYDSKDEL